MSALTNKIKNGSKKSWQHIKTFFINFYKKTITKLKDEQSLLRYVLYLIMVGLLFFALALISNAFTIPLSGDYVMQQIPFYHNGYDDWWHFFKTGEFVLWDSSTYLGTNNIGSNSFYYYLNPFFLPILLVPRALIPQGIAVLMIGKMVGAGLVMRVYLKYLGVTEKTSRLFGLIYAYCGWIAYYLWFNHFMEVAIVFPLIFLGIEKLLKEKKPWLLSFALFLMGMTNYFFLVSSAMAGVIYALFRYFQTSGKYSWKHRGQTALLGVFAFAVGILMSAMVFWPSIIVATSSDRVEGAFYLTTLKGYYETKQWGKLLNYILVWHSNGGADVEYKKFYPLISFLFPTVSDRSAALLKTGSYDNTISSLFVYSPTMLMLIPSLFHSIKKKKFSHLIPVVFFIFALFTPFFYNLFHGFTVDYGRWQIFAVVSLLAYLAINFDQRDQFKKWYYDVSGVVIFGLAAYTFYMASTFQSTDRFSDLQERLYVGIYQLVVIIIAYVITRIHARREIFTKYVTWFVTLEAIVMGGMIVSMHGVNYYVSNYDAGLKTVNDERAIIKKISKDDPSFYRIYNLNAGESSNINMRLGYNGLTSFHSLYNFNVMEFNEWSHLNYNHNGWSMGVHEKRYNLDTFLNVKYYLMRNIYDSYTLSSELDSFGHQQYLYQNVPLGFVRIDEYSTDLHAVYKNENYIEGGFSYDQLIKTNYDPLTGRSDLYRNTDNEVLTNEEAYLKGAILANEDASEVNTLAPHLAINSVPLRNIKAESSKTKVVTCSDVEHFDPLLKDDFGTCIVKTINQGSSITNFSAHNSAIIIEPELGATFGSDSRSYFYALNLRLSLHATVYLFNEDNEIIVRDKHTQMNGYFKDIRGYYASEPVQRIVIIPKTAATASVRYPYVYQEAYDDYLDRLDGLNNYPLTDFSHTANKMKFKTDYQQARFIVLSTPYDPGWSVKAVKEDGTIVTTKVYKAQGGFVGFLSQEGLTNYTASYMTPYLPEGLLVSLGGFLLFGGSLGAAYLVWKLKEDKKKFKKEPEENETTN